jgi:hypothetical protein
MTVEELSAYFENIALPEQLRLDRACTQFNVADRVNHLLENMKVQPENWRHKHQLIRIKNALENLYAGPEIPRL